MLMRHEVKVFALGLFLFLGLAGAAEADAGLIHEENATVYTGNFAVIEKTAGDVALQSSEDNIGMLGDFAVVKGEKNPHHLAYVRKNSGQGYLILDRLYVKCARRNPCAIPEKYRAEKLSSRLYEVPVSDYEEWKKMREDLRRIPGVIKVSESYGYGFKPDLE